MVAINKNSSATLVSLFISEVAPCTATPRVTSDTDNIRQQGPITVTDARFGASLEPESVTTFVGTR